MKEIEALIAEATLRDADPTQRHEAFGEIVKRFQDMAFGCAYAILGDFQHAEDAAQEAFIEAYRDLPKLREAKAFSGWFRQIVVRQCHRMTRRKSLPTEPIEVALEMPSDEKGPAEAAEANELKDRVLAAIKGLPEDERMVTTLFYINGYSQKEIAAFMEMSVTTVNNRLRASRKRLKERLVDNMVRENLQEKRPSRDDQFVKEVLFKAIAMGDMEKVGELIEGNPNLLHVTDERGRTPTGALARDEWIARVIREADSRKAIYDLLLSKGGEPDLVTAIALNDVARARELITADPKRIESRFDVSDYHGARPLAIAACYGRKEIVKLLIEAGADIHADKDLALIMAIGPAENFVEVTELLITHGAEVNPYPNASYGPLVHACSWLYAPAVKVLLANCADPNACVLAEFRGQIGPPGWEIYAPDWQHPAQWVWPGKMPISPLFVTLGTSGGYIDGWDGLPEIVEALIQAGTDFTHKQTVSVDNEELELTPLAFALKNTTRIRDEKHLQVIQKAIKTLRRHGAPE